VRSFDQSSLVNKNYNKLLVLKALGKKTKKPLSLLNKDKSEPDRGKIQGI